MRQATTETRQRIHKAFVALGWSEDRAARFINSMIIDMTNESGGEMSEEDARKFAEVCKRAAEEAERNKPELDQIREIHRQCARFPDYPFWEAPDGSVWEFGFRGGVGGGYKLQNTTVPGCEYFRRITEASRWLRDQGFKHIGPAPVEGL